MQGYIDKDFRQRIELSDFDITGKEPNAEGGRVGFFDGGYTEDAYGFLKEMQDDIYKQFKYYKSLGGKMKFGEYARNAAKKYFAKGGIVGLHIWSHK